MADRDAIIEECAKVCDVTAMADMPANALHFEAAKWCARAIRALKVKPSSEPPSVVAAAREFIRALDNVHICHVSARNRELVNAFDESVIALRDALQTPTKESQPRKLTDAEAMKLSNLADDYRYCLVGDYTKHWAILRDYVESLLEGQSIAAPARQREGQT